MDTKTILKKSASTALSANIIASKAAKYGAHLSLGISKIFFNGATSLASQFSGSSFKLGLGDFLLQETEKGINYGFDKLIQAQQYVKGKIR